MSETQAYRDAVTHAAACGTEWPHQYVLDCGWGKESIRLTAELGVADEDAIALGDHAGELVDWCRQRVAED